MRNSALRLGVVLSLLLGLASCGSVQGAAPPSEARPAWVAGGSVDDVFGRHVPGTGFARGPDALARALVKASLDARAAFAQSLSSTIKSEVGTIQVQDGAGERGEWWLRSSATARTVEVRGSQVEASHHEPTVSDGQAGVQAWARLFVPAVEVERLHLLLAGRAALADACVAPEGWPCPASAHARLAEVAHREGLNAEPASEPQTVGALQAAGVAWKIDAEVRLASVREERGISCAWVGLTWRQQSTLDGKTTTVPIAPRKGCAARGDRSRAVEQAFDDALLDLLIELGRVG